MLQLICESAPTSAFDLFRSRLSINKVTTLDYPANKDK